MDLLPLLPSHSRGARRSGAILRWSLTADLDRAVRDAPPAHDADALAERAEYHGISPLVHLATAGLPDVDRAAARQLESSYHHAVRRHVFILDDLADIDGWLADLDHPWLVIKGPVLASSLYRRPDHRSYTDLDIVVPRMALEPTIARLVDQGATPLDADWSGSIRQGRGEVELRLRSGTVVDLHWHLINRPMVRDRFTIDLDRLFERARTVDVGGHPYRTLGRDDTVVHLALHAVLSGGDRLVWVKDLQMAVEAEPHDGDSLAATARSWGALPALATQLDRTCRLVGAGRLPDAWRAPLTDGRSWAATCRAADWLAPPPRSQGELSIAKRVSRATAPTTGGGWRELARAVGRGVRRGVGRGAQLREGARRTAGAKHLLFGRPTR